MDFSFTYQTNSHINRTHDIAVADPGFPIGEPIEGVWTSDMGTFC